MYFQKPAKVLAQNAIDYDILPADIFVKSMPLIQQCMGANLLLMEKNIAV